VKVIFLDIDGVLCTARSHLAATTRFHMRHLDPVGTRLVGRLCDEFDAKIVLSSTWRKEFDQDAMTVILLQAGLSDVPWHQCWKTPTLYGDENTRGKEIAEWHRNNQGVTDYVILDDDSDMNADQVDHFVQTDSYDGLSYLQWERARSILGAKKPEKVE
jgi:hypothetical protein